MFSVALTGNIASGKSTVAQVWRALGATIIEADELARRAVEPGTEALARIAEQWGPGILMPDGRLDRAALRDVVFRDDAERRQLENIVHPEVKRLRQEALDAAERAGLSIVVSDIPLLFEAGMEEEFDLIVVVDAPEAVRRARLVRERDIEEAEADRMIASQWSAVDKRRQADVVIDNSASLEGLRVRAREVWSDLVDRADRRAEQE